MVILVFLLFLMVHSAHGIGSLSAVTLAPLLFYVPICFPFFFGGSFGLWDWLTVGADVGAIIFLRKEQQLHMKTNACQSGFIKLAQGAACVKPGTIWHITTYFKADHFCRGLS